MSETSEHMSINPEAHLSQAEFVAPTSAENIFIDEKRPPIDPELGRVEGVGAGADPIPQEVLDQVKKYDFAEIRDIMTEYSNSGNLPDELRTIANDDVLITRALNIRTADIVGLTPLEPIDVQRAKMDVWLTVYKKDYLTAEKESDLLEGTNGQYLPPEFMQYRPMFISGQIHIDDVLRAYKARMEGIIDKGHENGVYGDIVRDIQKLRGKLNTLQEKLEKGTLRPGDPIIEQLEREILEYEPRENKRADTGELKGTRRRVFQDYRENLRNQIAALSKGAMEQTRRSALEKMPLEDLISPNIKELAPSAQLARVRVLLETLESGKDKITVDRLADTLDLKKAIVRLELFISQGEIASEVAAEFRARLNLHDVYVYTSQLGGNAKSIKEKFDTLKGSARYLNGADLNLFFHGTNRALIAEGKNALQGIPVQEAWGYLQQAATEGVVIGGRKVILTFQPSPQNMMIENQIMGKLGPEGATALKLAKRLASATLEDAVWDTQAKTFAGKLVYLDTARRGAGAEDAGPIRTITEVPTLATSFFRVATYKGALGTEVRFIDNLPTDRLREMAHSGDERVVDQVVHLTDQLYRMDQIGSRSNAPVRIYPDVGRLDFENLDERAHVDYLTKYVTSAALLKEEFLRSNYKPEDFNKDNLAALNTLMEQVDKYDIFNFRFHLVQGIFHNIYNKGVRKSTPSAILSQWNSLEKVVAVLTALQEPIAQKENGQNISFFDRIQAQALRREFAPIGKAAMSDVLDKAFGRVDIFK